MKSLTVEHIAAVVRWSNRRQWAVHAKCSATHVAQDVLFWRRPAGQPESNKRRADAGSAPPMKLHLMYCTT